MAELSGEAAALAACRDIKGWLNEDEAGALYRHAFENFRMGYASTLAWMLFLIVLIFTVIQFVMARHWVYYEAGGR